MIENGIENIENKENIENYLDSEERKYTFLIYSFQYFTWAIFPMMCS